MEVGNKVWVEDGEDEILMPAEITYFTRNIIYRNLESQDFQKEGNARRYFLPKNHEEENGVRQSFLLTEE